MAERLTKRFDSGNVGFFKDGTPTENAMKLPKIMELLAAYEDTGLEPSEVVDTVKLLQDVATKYETSVKINSINTGLLNKAQEELEAYRALGTVEELAELVSAHKDGRAPILPCKVGDTIYCIGGVDDECDTEIEEKTVYAFLVGEDGRVLLKSDAWDGAICYADELGKIVGSPFWQGCYLIPEEAEAKLKEGQDG